MLLIARYRPIMWCFPLTSSQDNSQIRGKRVNRKMCKLVNNALMFRIVFPFREKECYWRAFAIECQSLYKRHALKALACLSGKQSRYSGVHIRFWFAKRKGRSLNHCKHFYRRNSNLNATGFCASHSGSCKSTIELI